MSDFQSTTRFSDRVANYIRYRPGYPAELVTVIAKAAQLPTPAVVADIGSGTGISSALFLARGDTVEAIEPNGPMREAAEARFAGHPRFRSHRTTAEQTGLADDSVDLIIAGQAFHWFEPARTRTEFARILKPGGHVALFWNERLTDATPFLQEYEQMLLEFSEDYEQVNHTRIDHEAIRQFFGHASWVTRTFPNSQSFDFEGLQGRLLSSSYAPGKDHPRHAPMLAALRELFDRRSREGRVEFLYETNLYLGTLPAG